MYTHIPVGDDLSVFLFFCAAMVGFGIAATQEGGRKRNVFAVCAAISFVCALFWPSIKDDLPGAAAYLSWIAGYRATFWLLGIAFGFLSGFFLRRNANVAGDAAVKVGEREHLIVDFDTHNSTGFYWFDKSETRPHIVKKTGLLQEVRFDEKFYCIRITNNTNKVLRNVRAFLLFPGRSPEECSFSFGSHTDRDIHVGASDYINITSVPNPGHNASTFEPNYRTGYELTINCEGYPQIKKRLELDTTKFPALTLLD